MFPLVRADRRIGSLGIRAQRGGGVVNPQSRLGVGSTQRQWKPHDHAQDRFDCQPFDWLRHGIRRDPRRHRGIAERGAAARSVNALMTATYWEIGRRIVEGKKLQTLPAISAKPFALPLTLAGIENRLPLPWSAYVRLPAVKNTAPGGRPCLGDAYKLHSAE